jgi:hypothetical protein
MERITKEFTKSIFNVDYTFEVEFSYYPSNYAIDPTDYNPAELQWHEYTGPIHAWDNATEIGYEVDPEELEKLINIDELFIEAIS